VRIAFFGQTGPYAPYALTELMREARPYNLALVVEGKKSSRPEHRLRDPRKPISGSTLAEMAASYGIPALVSTDVNDPKSIAIIGEHRVDLLICVGFDRLFSVDLLATAPRGGINAHPSDLPRLRGPAPIFWALKEGRTRMALSLHGLDAREDHGPIFAQEWFAPSSLAAGDVIFRTAGELAGKMLVTLLAKAVDRELVGAPQDHRRATRAPRPRPEDAFVQPLEWTCDALVRFACGAPYFRTPWLSFGDDTYFVRRGLKAERGKRVPGEHAVMGSQLVVQCRDGTAHLEIQV
jgi:methionyl-tRNA formyltransferase